MTAKEFETKRHLMGYTRKALGTAMSTSHRNIENWELGKYPVPSIAGRLLELIERNNQLGRMLIVAGQPELGGPVRGHIEEVE